MSILFSALLCAYAFAGVLGLVIVLRVRSVRRQAAMSCSCQAAASVESVRSDGKYNRVYTLEYYDMADKRHLVDFRCYKGMCKLFLHEVIRIYYNPHDFSEISIPHDSADYVDLKLGFAIGVFLYILFGAVGVALYNFLH